MRTALRPLGIGEMLDRAVTLSVRFFAPFALIWVLYLVPLTVLSYYATADSANFMYGMLDQVRHGGSTDPRAVQQFMSGPHFGAAVGWYVALSLLGYPLVNGVLLRSVSDAYLDGRTPMLGQAYGEGVRQWLPLIGITLIWIAFALLLYVVVLLVTLVFALAIGLLLASVKLIGTVVAVIAGLAALFLIVVAVTLGFLSFQIACVTQVVENVGFVRAFSIGLARVVGRERRRSFAYGLSLFAVYVGMWLVGIVGQGLIMWLLRSHLVSSVLAAALGVAFAVLGAALVVVYYYDVRVRTEGYDLERAVTAGESISPA